MGETIRRKKTHQSCYHGDRAEPFIPTPSISRELDAGLEQRVCMACQDQVVRGVGKCALHCLHNTLYLNIKI